MSRHPGKFEGCADQTLGERLYTLTLDGAHDDELGNADTFGWYALIVDVLRAYIVAVDSQGFFTYDEYSIAGARRAWAKLEREYEKFCADGREHSGEAIDDPGYFGDAS